MVRLLVTTPVIYVLKEGRAKGGCNRPHFREKFVLVTMIAFGAVPSVRNTEYRGSFLYTEVAMYGTVY